MDESSKHKHRLEVPEDAQLPREVKIWKWFVFYFLFLALLGALLVAMLADQSPQFEQELQKFGEIRRTVHPWHKMLRAELAQVPELVSAASSWLKGVLLALYCSMGITFFPIPVNAAIAAAATTMAGMRGGPVLVTLGLSLICAFASTIANLTDYHIFLMLLRSRRIAKVRNTRLYKAAARWFGKAPFAIMVIFNIIPLPVDIIRILAAVYGVKRRVFAAANFVGRFFRYAVIVALTLLIVARHPEYRWIPSAALLGLSAVIAMIKIGPALWKKFAGGAAGA